MEEFEKNIKRSSEEWKLIEAYDKEWAMKDLGRQDGRREGIKESTTEITKKLLKEGIDISTISKCTGLSEKEIIELKNEKS